MLARYPAGVYAEPVSRTIGQNIVRMRKARGIRTQGALAKKLGVPQPQLSDWENDRYAALELPTLLRIATAIPCRVDDLLDGVYEDYDQANAGSDLLCHRGDVEQPHQKGGVHDAAETRLLREQVDRYRAQTEEVHDIARRLAIILAKYAVDAEGSSAAAAPSSRSRRDRKARHRSA